MLQWAADVTIILSIDAPKNLRKQAHAMFNSVTISNFRTFQTAVLDELGITTAFIGRNGVGKSNLLHALEMLGRLASADSQNQYYFYDDIPHANQRTDRQEPLQFAANIILPSGRYLYELSVVANFTRAADAKGMSRQLQLTERVAWTGRKSSAKLLPIFERHNELITIHEENSPRADSGTPPTNVLTNHDTPALAALSALLPTKSPIRRLTDPLRLFLKQVRYYSLDEPARITASPTVITGGEYNEWVTKYLTSGVLGKPVTLQILHMALTMEDHFSDLKERLGDNGLKLIDDINIIDILFSGIKPPKLDPDTGLLDPKSFVLMNFRLGRPRVVRQFSQLSQGTRRLVRLLTAMAYGENSVMLVEHPEDSIHRGLVKKVTALFATGYCPSQFFLSTHSDAVLNGLKPEDVRFVSEERGQSTVRRMSEVECKVAGRYIDSDDEGTLADFVHSIEE